jgi:hypothetical protein
MKPRRILETELCWFCKGTFPELCLICNGVGYTDKQITIHPDGGREIERPR